MSLRYNPEFSDVDPIKEPSWTHACVISQARFSTDNAVHDHCYPGLQVQSTSLDGKERKMEAKLKNSTEIDSLMDHSEASPYSLRDEADTVRANANERKCQISLIPVQVTESQRQFQTASDVNVMSAGVRGRVSQCS